MNQAPTESGFVIDFQKCWFGIHFPVFCNKFNDFVCAFGVVLIEVGLTIIHVNSIDRYDAAVASNISWCY